MSAKQTFITNSKTKKLKNRLLELIEASEELKFLIGFFYFSGISELYEGLKSREEIKIKVLVGLNVDQTIHGLTEYGDNTKHLSDGERVQRFFDSVERSINSNDFDNQRFYEQVNFFIDLIKKDKLIIRKTYKPNHAKLYLFKLKEGQIKESVFVTGSSNLTKAGLLTQEEFNVEISDYGTSEAEIFFDELWEEAVQITEHEQFKKTLIDLIENKTLIAEVAPFEAFVLVLKNYLESQNQKELQPSLIQLLLKNDYKPYKYQQDAVRQALAIIEHYGGVVISDVVGLGKSIIASMVAKSIGKRGLIICRPNLIGDENKQSGWQKYKEDFKLYDWEIRSWGKLDKALELVRNNEEFEIVIIDEAHNFRNQDTEDYELLSDICRNKIVILLTATPFNNSPGDIFSLLKLFIVPGKSKITLDNKLDQRFAGYNSAFKKLSFIKKHINSPDEKKRKKARDFYKKLFDEEKFEQKLLIERARQLSIRIRSIIEPVLIRRNRIDLKTDPEYSKEMYELSEIKDPQELFFELTSEQNKFYDQVINSFFSDNGQFSGAIYQPFNYEIGAKDTEIDDEGQEKNRERLTQKNLYDFMRRLLVKRFESSFGAFKASVRNFKNINEIVLKFIEKSGGKYILDRKLIEKVFEDDEEAIAKALEDFSKRMDENKKPNPRTDKIYETSKFKHKEEFFRDIKSDIKLFDYILTQLQSLKLIEEDPKLKCLISEINKTLSSPSGKKEPERKIIIFSEYLDTVKYLEPKLHEYFGDKLLTIKDDLSSAKIEKINENFDAIYKTQINDVSALLATDKISEGFNLNRAGAIVNYDIPWNPTRVIQRVGRINRISKKVFEELYIYNFFPTQKGADIIRSRQIASDKMFVIHNTLGEDAKIFDADEEPSAAKLFTKVNTNPEEYETESFQTKIRRRYHEIADSYPDIVEKVNNLPSRIKVTKKYKEDNLLVFIKKALGFFVRSISNLDDPKIDEPDFEEVFELIECKPDEKRLELSDRFWDNYTEAKDFKEVPGIPKSEQSVEKKAINNLKYMLTKVPELAHYNPFIRILLEDALEYKTLADYTLRRIANLKTASGKDLKETKEELSHIMKKLGENYLEKIKEKLGEISSEVIIAIENRTS